VAAGGVAGFLDAVGVVARSLDDAGAGAVPAGRGEVPPVGDVGFGLGQQFLALLRGKSRVGDPAARDADGALELDLVRVESGRGRGGAGQGR